MGVKSTIEAIIEAIRKRGEPEEVKADKAVDEELNKIIPEGLSGREGLLAHRKRMRLIDENWENR